MDNCLKILSWNCLHLDSDPTNNGLIADIVKNENIDVVALIESTNSSDNIIQLFVDKGLSFFKVNTSTDEDIKVFAKDTCRIRGVKAKERWCEAIYKDDQNVDVRFIFVHLPAKNASNEITHHFRNSRIAEEIKSLFKDGEGNFIVGDFNENPYEASICSYNCFNGVFPSMINRVKQKYVIRALCDQEYFINPSWDIFVGDDTSGTFYFKDNSMDCLGWNVLDQVVMSVPAYEKHYMRKSLKALTKSKNVDLLKKGIPNKEYSDHLPIVFDIQR